MPNSVTKMNNVNLKQVHGEFYVGTDTDISDEMLEEAEYNTEDAMIRNIQGDLRGLLPMSAVLPSENIIVPTAGQV